MLPALLCAALAVAADPPSAPPPVVDVRVWPSEPAMSPAALEERYPSPDPALGVHTAVHRVELDGCWRQQAALAQDLDLWFCADLKIDKKGRTKAKVVHLSDPRPGLATCLEASLRSWQGPSSQPVKGSTCREVRTHISEAARDTWKTDAWAELEHPGAPGDPSAAPPHRVGRPRVEGAQAIEGDAQTGDMVRVDHPIKIRDRAATTAKRLVASQPSALAQCWADRAGFRKPERSGEDALLAYTLEVTVGPTGPVHIAAGAALPHSHLDVAECVAAAIDPDLTVSEGDLVIEIPVLVEPPAE